MKNGIIILILTLSWGFGQCDANGDGELDVLDVVVEVNCILTDCWEPEPSICDGLTEVELWGEYYDIGTTTEIELYAQGLTGSIPPEIGCLTNLEYLSLENNQLTGSIPPEIGNLTGLTTLNLWGNQLSGEIPVEIGNLTNLTYLTLTSNQLTGEIPVEIGNLTNLTGLYLGWNQLTGEIPPEIGNLENLTYLYLYFNQLTGEIPQAVCDLIESNNLDMDNILTGNNLINTCEETTDVCEDIDGNVYETIQIGDQLWMAENLKVTHYNDSSDIPTGYSNEEWAQLETGAYAVYDDDPSNLNTYGNLYNWYTVDDDRGVCPEGFHVPSDEEYTVLTDYLDGENVAGGKMKEAGLEHWNSPNTGATNESGFTALPAGYRYPYGGIYNAMGTDGYFWSSSELNSNEAWDWELIHDNSTVLRNYNLKPTGLSIRCLGD